MLKDILNMWTLAFVLGIFGAAPALVHAKPNKVIIIRHAEKIPGENHLDQKGYERAGALPYYFAGTPTFNTPEPKFVFATGLENPDSSVRPIETCAAIANHFHIPMNVNYKRKETKELANEVLTNPMYDNTNIIICWDHGNIAKLTMAFGADDPGLWDHRIFDQVYMLSFGKDPKPKFEKLLQKLMFGDRATFNDEPIARPKPTKKNVDES